MTTQALIARSVSRSITIDPGPELPDKRPMNACPAIAICTPDNADSTWNSTNYLVSVNVGVSALPSVSVSANGNISAKVGVSGSVSARSIAGASASD